MEDPGAGEQSMLWLATQVTEVEALFALALTAPTLLTERRALGELSEAAERLAFYARHTAGGMPLRRTPGIRVAPGSARARRRAAIARRGADLIVMWATRRP
ncbi:hypothetical protein [Actinocorallia populi]|uniref:hypothetical protein n=1 Tax=Actinocorallia populi TaxID=2079200 RepID=UPI000D08D119|nr:hypothetical protein [Actinocorallia populi]